MKVSISKAADMVGITRATLYRHIDKKGITKEQDEDGNPLIDTSELIRVYGDKVRIDGHERKKDSDDTGDTIQAIQPNTGGRGHVNTVESEVQRERIEGLQNEIRLLREERDRERGLLSEQITMFRDRLIESEQQQKRLTLLLTSDKETTQKEEGEQKQKMDKMDKMEETIQKLERQNKLIHRELQEKKRSWWDRTFKRAG